MIASGVKFRDVGKRGNFMKAPLRAVLLVAVLLQVNVAMAQSCYESSILSPSPFMGNNGEIFKLADGSLWEVKFEYEYMYEYLPDVVICPGRGKLLIAGKSLNVQQIPTRQAPSASRPAPGPTPGIIETQIDGDFTGWSGDTVFKLLNGQIWQQSSYAYTYSYRYAPKVTIFKNGPTYEMQVEGVDTRIKVKRLK
jgi:hypothetical protein